MNASAEKALMQLLSNGNAIASVYQSARGGDGSLDWSKFTAAVQSQGLIDHILGLPSAEINAALAEVRAERKRLRDEWRGKKMPGEVLDRLSHLSDIGIELVDRKLDVGLTPAYVDWMMEKALPLLSKAAPILFAGRK